MRDEVVDSKRKELEEKLKHDKVTKIEWSFIKNHIDQLYETINNKTTLN